MISKMILAGAVILAASAMPETGRAQAAPDTANIQAGDVVKKGFGKRVQTGYYRRPYRRYYPRRGYYRGYRPRVSAGIFIGAPFAFGGYYGGYYAAPPPVVIYRPAPRRAYRRGHYEPWTPGWVSYCRSKYRTFNARTGYYYYKPGRRRFCR